MIWSILSVLGCIFVIAMVIGLIISAIRTINNSSDDFWMQ